MAAPILIVEDNAANLELMTYLLRANGHTIVGATTAEEALEVVRRQRFGLILCDLLLPGMDGYTFAAACRQDEELREIPLVAVTALAMVGDRERILQANFDGYISKPIDPETFNAQVEGLLTARRARSI